MANRWGNNGKQCQTLFFGAPKSLKMVTAAMKFLGRKVMTHLDSIFKSSLNFQKAVKEESKQVCLKLNIQKTKIMASGPITSWQIDGETMENSERLFFGLQNHRRW